jgi:amidase
MLSRNDWRAHDALGLARLVAERQVTARELVERAIAEIEERNGALNAVVYRRFDEALAEADALLASGPLAGVPYLVKNLHLPVRGLPLTHGSRLFAGNVPQFDATLAARLRKAGLLLLGRTSSPDILRADRAAGPLPQWLPACCRPPMPRIAAAPSAFRLPAAGWSD